MKPKWENRLDISEALLLGEEDIKKKDELIEAHFVGVRKLIRSERQKIAKALRMGEIKAGHGGSATEYDSWYADGFNKAVEEINQIINSYLKKQEGG